MNTRKNLENITVVSVVDFIKTYSGKRVPDYGLAYLEEFGSLYSIGSLLSMLGPDERYPNIEPSLEDASGFTINSYENDRTKPRSVQALERLRNMDIIFPIKYTSNCFKRLFTLYANCLWSGSINSKFWIYIHKYPGMDLEDARKLLEEETSFNLKTFQITNTITIKGDDRGDNSAVGRVVHLLGELPIGAGSKARNRIRLRRVEELQNLLKNELLNETHTTIAKSLLFSFIKELFRHKLRRSKSGFILRVGSNYNREFTKEFSDSIQSLLNYMLKSTRFNYRVYAEHPEPGLEIYSSTFYLGETNIKRLIKEYDDELGLSMFI